MSDELKAALPCPFCGYESVSVIEGSTFRWRLAECSNCGARSGEVRIQTLGDGTREHWEDDAKNDAIAEWNKRAAIANEPAEPTQEPK